MNRIKTDPRNRLKTDTLDRLIRISCGVLALMNLTMLLQLIFGHQNQIEGFIVS